MNWGRIILGGLLAGLVMNISEFILHEMVLGEAGRHLVADWKARGFSLPTNPDPNMLMMLVGITFVLGLLAVWTYAAIRPRFGPGVKTALCAGLAVWAMSALYAGVYLHAGIQIYPGKLTWLPVAWGLVEIPLATVVGAWPYKE
jgi:hypothetical protein